MKVVYYSTANGQVQLVYTGGVDRSNVPAGMTRLEVPDNTTVDRDMKYDGQKFVASPNPVAVKPDRDIKAEYAAQANDAERIAFIAQELGLV